MESEAIRVLMIEDDPAYVDLVRLYLKDPDPTGFSCVIENAASLAEGLRRLNEGGIDAVVCDLGLPDARGLEGPTQVLKTYPDLPLIVLTGSGNEEMAVEAVRLGAQDFLAKSSADARGLRRALRYALERKSLRRLDELKDRWIAVLSHELRTPLTVIKGVIVDLCESTAEPATPHQRLLLTMARRHTDRIVRMVSNLLDLSRLESGYARIERRPFDACAAGRVAADDAMRAAKERGVSIAFECAPEAPAIVGDPDLFSRLLTNLVDNAVRYARSRVTVRADEGPGGTFRLTVSDDGPGIPGEKKSLLFTRFTQLERRAEPEGYRGTGLGLAICKEIVAAHGGSIEAVSEPGRGTSFVATFPGTPASAKAPRPDERAGKRRIVVVDDEPDYVRILEMWLRPHFDVKTLTRGHGAADEIRAFRPDIVLLDVHMSDESGFKVCRRLKADAATAGIPVVFLSGSKSNEDIRLHAEVGGARYLLKPIEKAALFEALVEQLQHAPAG